jgi:hypothetical protein
MKKIFLFTSAFLLLSVGSISYAQEPPARQAPPQEKKGEGTPVTLKGCLTKGSQAQTYTVADEASGEKVMFAGPAKLDSYLNQTVAITGAIVESGGEKSFQPQSIKTIAASCKSGKE